MGNRTTRFLTVSLVLVSVFCVVVFSIQAAWNSAVGAEAITDIGVIYMSGMSEQIATHFGTTIELRLSQVGALADSVPPERSGSGSAAMRVALTHSARSRGFSCLAFCTQEGEFDVIYGPAFTSGMAEPFISSLRRGEQKISAGWSASGVPMVLMGVPAAYPLDGGTKSVALVAGLPTSYLVDTLSLNVESTTLDYTIIRRDGSFIVPGHMEGSDNFFDRAQERYDRAGGRETGGRARCASGFLCKSSGRGVVRAGVLELIEWTSAAFRCRWPGAGLWSLTPWSGHSLGGSPLCR